MSTHYSDSSDHPARKTAGRRGKTGREVICKICQAVYVPAWTHMQLARSPQAVVESAFMGMCHFCFRCRRPACPSCWDDVHGVCGACALEAQLSFRSSAPPLDGVIFPPIHHLQLARVHTLAPPLVCVRPGRFQRAPLPVEAQTTVYLQTIADQPIDDPGKKKHSQKIPVSSSLLSSEMQSNTVEHTPDATLDSSSLSSVPVSKPLPDIEDIVTRPEKRRVQREESSRRAQSQRLTARVSVVDVADVATRPARRLVRGEQRDRTTKIHQDQDRLQRVLTDTLALIALLVIIFIVGALFSPAVNDGIAHVLHVDIRAEIAYLLQLIQHLF